MLHEGPKAAMDLCECDAEGIHVRSGTDRLGAEIGMSRNALIPRDALHSKLKSARHHLPTFEDFRIAPLSGMPSPPYRLFKYLKLHKFDP